MELSLTCWRALPRTLRDLDIIAPHDILFGETLALLIRLEVPIFSLKCYGNVEVVLPPHLEYRVNPQALSGQTAARLCRALNELVHVL